MNPYLEIGEEVRDVRGKGVVALESTIISHGMPWPKNAETAMEVEEAIRSAGAVPATIAILDGKLKVGLTRSEIERLAKAGLTVRKVSRRDLSHVVSRRECGATTVSATMIIAAMAGIKVFATGGIGGVHRHGQNTWDVSADLEELGRTAVAVVCAGAKAILDLHLTLEYLETHGVPVIGFGTDELPAFYSARSGIALEMREDNPHEIARHMHAQWGLGLTAGLVIANPIPAQYSMEESAIRAVIDKAIAQAESEGIQGKHLTPYLLSQIEKSTGGKSLEANIALVLSNARVGARIATAWAGLAHT